MSDSTDLQNEREDAPHLYVVGLPGVSPKDVAQPTLEILCSADVVMVPSPYVRDVLTRVGVTRVEVVDAEPPAIDARSCTVYCSFGAPTSTDVRVRKLRKEAFACGMQIDVRESHPLTWHLRRRLGEGWPFEGGDPGLRCLSPMQLSAGLSGGEAQWVEGLYSDRDISAVGESLRRQYPHSHAVRMFDVLAAFPGDGGEEFTLKCVESRVQPGGRFVLYIPGLDLPRMARDDLVPAGQAASGIWGVVHRLRAPGGCPWDQKQTHRTLRPFLLEECHELAAALERGDAVEVEEELGDVLLQVVLHAVIACERGEFGAADVMMTLAQKMTERHPHVFAGLEVSGADDVETNWEKIKSKSSNGAGRSHLAGIPETLPALLQAEKMQSVASRVGFDWDDVRGPADKIDEEAREFSRALKSGDGEVTGEELGDLLFSLVNAARHLNLSAETELLGAVEKFRSRFAAIEQEAERRGSELDEMTLTEMDEIWERKKRGK